MLAELVNSVLSRSRNSGAQAAARAAASGELCVADAHGRYQEAVLQGNCFFACNSATQALSVNSTTATGLILTNPPSSGKNIVLLEWDVAIASLPAGQSALILTGSNVTTNSEPTHTTPLTVRNAFLGSAAGAVGKADSAATIPANTIFKVLGGGPAATVAGGTGFPPFIKDELAGSIVLAPGTCISLQALTTAMTVVSYVLWEEVPA